ncbi:hypothetical protein V6N11_005751 [Hibiscus sabdariffa]|uniref:Inhibitor I9 domain-containing protein n=1 Tax=Hibiscus sabdariffa TaxID=183260 RepID=A0ABR2RP28_9ROSI
MEGQRLSLLHYLLFHVFILALLAIIGLSQSDKKSYIVYLGNLPKGGSSTTLLHNSMLQDVFGSDPVAKSVLYSYKRSFNGFVVELTEDEARKIAGNEPKDVSFSYPLPASHLDMVDGSKILIYINSTSNATASIFKSDEGNDTLAPYVASFSSRGPSPITPDILKDMELGCFNKLPETTLDVLKQQMEQFRI